LKQLLALSASVLLLLLDHNVVLQCEGVDFGYGATRSRGALWRLRDWGLTAEAAGEFSGNWLNRKLG